MLDILYASESEPSENSNSEESISDNSSRPSSDSESEESDSSSNSDGDVAAPSTSTQKKIERGTMEMAYEFGKTHKFKELQIQNGLKFIAITVMLFSLENLPHVIFTF